MIKSQLDLCFFTAVSHLTRNAMLLYLKHLIFGASQGVNYQNQHSLSLLEAYY